MHLRGVKCPVFTVQRDYPFNLVVIQTIYRLLLIPSLHLVPLVPLSDRMFSNLASSTDKSLNGVIQELVLSEYAISR